MKKYIATLAAIAIIAAPALSLAAVNINLPGDLNNDGVINQKDYDIIDAAWTNAQPSGAVDTSDPNSVASDINGDGYINSTDYSDIDTNHNNPGNPFFPPNWFEMHATPPGPSSLATGASLTGASSATTTPPTCSTVDLGGNRIMLIKNNAWVGNYNLDFFSMEKECQ